MGRITTEPLCCSSSGKKCFLARSPNNVIRTHVDVKYVTISSLEVWLNVTHKEDATPSSELVGHHARPCRDFDLARVRENN